VRQDSQSWADIFIQEGEEKLKSNQLQDAFSNFRILHSTHFNISSPTPSYGHPISNEQGKLDRWGNIMRPCSIALPSLRLQCSVTMQLLQIPAQARWRA